jgi:TRAP-type C4-dicarboxylate transport system permease small subunit
MRKIQSIYLYIEKVIYWIAYLAIFLIMIGISLDALSRVFFNAPIQGTYEVVSLYLMIIVVFIGLGYSFKNEEHVKITVLYQYFPRKGKLVADIIGTILSILLFSIIGIEGYQMTNDAWINDNYTFGIVSLPMFLSYIWVPLGTFLLVIRLLVQLILKTIELFKPTKVGDEK